MSHIININMKRVFKVKEVIDILTSQGWYLDRQNGTSHRQFNKRIEYENIKSSCM